MTENKTLIYFTSFKEFLKVVICSICRGHKDKIYQIKWNPFDNTKLVTVGVKHIKFWVQAGKFIKPEAKSDCLIL